METFEAKSHLDNQLQQHPDSRLQSDPSIDSDTLVQALALDLHNLVISCKDEALDRDLHAHSVVIDGDDEVKRVIDEELRQLVVTEAVSEAVQAESPNGSGEENHKDVRRLIDEAIERHSRKTFAEEDPKECRVLEERKAGDNGVGCESQEESGDEKFVEDHDKDSNEKHEIEIVDGDGSREIGGWANDNGEQRWSEDGHDRDYENVQDLENMRRYAVGDGGEGGSLDFPDDGRLKSYHYPLRPDAEDCTYYMRTGLCKFGSNCKFNHPLKRRNQSHKEPKKQKEENFEKPGHIECKYYLSSVGCKYGKACKYNHTSGKTAITPVVEYNFLGLPIRPGEKECPYYMRNGSCKYGPNCRFNHPDPTVVGGGDAPTTYGNDGPLPLLQTSPQPNMPSWASAPTNHDPGATFLPMMYSPTQNIPPPPAPPNPEWNNYQAPAHVYPSSERGLPIPPAFFLNNPPSDAKNNMYAHHHQQPQVVVSDYPERPGQPDCSFFMKTGDCKYRSSCKWNHPKSRITRSSTPSALSDKGLPLRPDQNICSHYSRYGICKYGPACKYDHPVNYNNSMPVRHGYRPDRSDGPLIQQPV